MSNPVKCSTANPALSGGIYTKNFFIGTRSEKAYGPTNITSYYNGYQIPPAGYVVYVYRTSNSPSNYVAADDGELIILANRLGGTSVTNAGDALEYLITTNPQTIVLNKDYENYIDESYLCYDFTYIPSYPRKGQNVYDISVASGTRNNGSLGNPGSFVFDIYGGCLEFNGNQALAFSTITPGNNTNYTFIAIVLVDTADSTYGAILSNTNGGVVTSAYGTVGGRISYNYYNGSWQTVSSTGAGTIPIGEWVHLAWTQNVSGQMEMYLNGVSVNTPAATATANGGPVNTIGKNWTAYFDGAIAKTFYYTERLDVYRINSHYYTGNIFRDPINNIFPERYFDAANPVANSQTNTLYNLMNPNSLGGVFSPSGSFRGKDFYGGVISMITGEEMSTSSVDASNAYTISFWMKYTGTTTAGTLVKVLDGSGAELKGDITGVGKLHFIIKDALGTSYLIQSTTPVSDGFWHHIVMSYVVGGNQDNTYPEYSLPAGMYMYIDGNLEASTTIVPGGLTINGNLKFGGHDFYLGPVITYSGFAFRQSEARLNYYSTLFRYNN